MAPPREVVALVRAGAQPRVRAAFDDTARPWWLDGVHLAALVLAALAPVPYLQDVWDWALRIDPGGHALGFGSTGWYPWSRGPGAQPRTLPYRLLPLVCPIALLRGSANSWATGGPGHRRGGLLRRAGAGDRGRSRSPAGGDRPGGRWPVGVIRARCRTAARGRQRSRVRPGEVVRASR